MPRAIPDDFAENYARMSVTQLCEHYTCGKETVARWRYKLKLPDKPIGKQPRPLPVNLDELADGRTIQELAEIVGLSREVLRMRLIRHHPDIYARCRAVTRQEREVPPDFAQLAQQMSVNEAATHFAATHKTVRKWIAAMPADWRDRREMVMRQRIAEQQKINAAAGRRNGQGFRLSHISGTQLLPAAPGGEAAKAANFLRRFYRPVYDAGKVHGRALAGVYVVGRQRLSADEMKALAARHGYDADDWRRVA